MYGRYVETCESIRAPRGPRSGDQHRPAHSVSRYRELRRPCRNTRRARFSHRRRCGYRRSTRHGEPALVQPPMIAISSSGAVPQVARDRYFRAGSSVKPFIMPRRSPPGSIARQRGGHLAGFIKVAPGVRGRAQFGAMICDDPGKSSNVGTGRWRCPCSPNRFEHADGVGIGPGHRQQLSGRIGRHAGAITLHWRPIGIATCPTVMGFRSRRCNSRHAYATLGAGGCSAHLLERVRVPYRSRVLDPKERMS